MSNPADSFMSTGRINIHATAIVIATRGFLFVGPAGSGKSMLAFACLASARRMGLFSALVSDDQVFVSRHGDHILAERPDTIAGLIELRGTGIAETNSIPSALLNYAVLPVRLKDADRLPAENERFEVFDDALLPLVRLPVEAPDPLAALSAFLSAVGPPEARRTFF